MKIANTAMSFSILALALGAGLFIDVQAATSPRVLSTNPANACQGALPAFETAIRKRPLAVQNEGASNAFVTCSFTSQGPPAASTYLNPTSVTIFVESVNGAAIQISCTGVVGSSGTSTQYVVKSVTAAASGAQILMTWDAADFEGEPANFPSGLFSIACNLPPGAAINDSYVFFREEIGN